MTLADDIAVIALGANLGDRAATLARAVAELGAIGEVVARSGVYETAPVGPPQPDYLNAIVLVRTTMESEAIMQALLQIERQLGRERRERWGPRVVDLDLVAHGARTLRTATLTLPHPEAHHRAFVLVPLAEVAPDAELVGYGIVCALVESLPTAARAGVRRAGELG